jgi:hypothetical protein
MMMDFEEITHPDFREDLKESAMVLGVYSQLDPRLLQPDNVAKLHLTMVTRESKEWLQSLGLGYRFGGS